MGNNNNNNSNNEIKKPKKRAFNFVKVAFLMFKNRSNDKHKQITKPTHASNGNWKKFVGSMRPLHLQDDDDKDDRRPLPPPPPPPPFPSTSPFSEEIICSGASPTPSYLSGDTMSQYASATNLYELDNPVESDMKEDDHDEVFDSLTGDEMIDVRAEQFITQFYQQMRLQNTPAFTGESLKFCT